MQRLEPTAYCKSQELLWSYFGVGEHATCRRRRISSPPPQPLPRYLSHPTQAHATPPTSRRYRHKRGRPDNGGEVLDRYTQEELVEDNGGEVLDRYTQEEL
eukprot:COSAG02_NODE_29572_length_566_cov_7.734475_1_plen_100_part_10